MTDSQPVPKQQFQNPEIEDFMNFVKLTKKNEFLDKRGYKLIENKN